MVRHDVVIAAGNRRAAMGILWPVLCIKGLKRDGAGLTVVGDDAQSICSPRPTVRNILDFPGKFSPPAEIVTLDRNYRSTQPILATANGVIELATERFTKNLWTDRQSSERPWLVSVRDEADQAAKWSNACWNTAKSVQA